MNAPAALPHQGRVKCTSRSIRSGKSFCASISRRRSSSGARTTSFFTREGGDAYLKELPKAEMHRLDSGHFAVEDCLDYISKHIHRFYRDVVAPREEADPRGRALIVTRIA